jgi:hypothetical protein
LAGQDRASKYKQYGRKRQGFYKVTEGKRTARAGRRQGMGREGPLGSLISGGHTLVCSMLYCSFLYTFRDISKKVSDFLWEVGGGIKEVHVLFTSNALLFQRH